VSTDPHLLQVETQESDDGIACITLRGMLTLGSAVTVRRILGKQLSDGRPAVIVDVRHLSAAHAATMTVFRAVARHQAPPGGCLVLVTGDRPHQLMPFAARTAPLVVCASLAEARALIRDGLPGHHRRLRLPPTPTAPAEARGLVRDACRDWDVAGVTEAAQTVVTELVDNAVNHARTPIEVSVTLRGPRLYLAVRDDSAQAPRTGGGAVDQDGPGTGGWGLYLVDVFADAWGVAPLPTGKRVWASIRTRPVGLDEPV
jgi:anti-sigma regulatory factor (Ser/Thr protein kinase)